MTQQVRRPVLTFIAATMSIILLAGCIVHVGASKANTNLSLDEDYSSVNKSLTIGEGKTIGDASAVNGSLTIKDNVIAQDVSSVNGRLSVGDNVTVDELSTVNGKITVGEGLVANSDVSTVNGKIELNEKSVVKGSVTSVNGKMELDGVEIEKNIETVNASITLRGNTHVQGNIIYKRRNNNNSYTKRNPVLRIGKDVKIDGNIILEGPVDLEFDDKSMNNQVIERFSDK
jgi:UDP-3-O-[3-hydroxymyristoyl] glucosamine N-acyltransferase